MVLGCESVMGNFRVLLAALLVVVGMMGEGSDAQRIQACGKSLTSTLEVACPNGFYGPQQDQQELRKRHHGHQNAVDSFEISGKLSFEQFSRKFTIWLYFCTLKFDRPS